MKNKKTIIILLIIGLLLTLFGINLIYINQIQLPIIKKINIKYQENKYSNLYIEIQNNIFKFNSSYLCQIKNKNTQKGQTYKAYKNKCNIKLENGNYLLKVIDKNNNITKKNISVNTKKILNYKLLTKEFYLIKGEVKEIQYQLDKIGDINIEYKIKDESIATINDNKITALNDGKTEVLVYLDNKMYDNFFINVTSIINNYEYIPKKEALSCHRYSDDDNSIIDTYLNKSIEEKGYKTRAGVVEAARFLTLKFPYRIPYFYENGRVHKSGSHFCDGEGRYYHKGLYLSEGKFKDIKKSVSGPSIWGCPLTNWEQNEMYNKGKKYPNGIDCSGFVSWALLNGGFDVGDIGSYMLPELGKRQTITSNLIHNNKVKAGDLIGLKGHIAIIIGIDNDHYYIAESLHTTKGLVVTKISKNKLINNSIYTFIINMDEFYQNDGNYQDMWT